MNCKQCKRPLHKNGQCLHWRCLKRRGLDQRKRKERPVTFDHERNHCTAGIISRQNDYL
jgi:hypothetical protein